MAQMTATEFAKNLKKALDRVQFGGEEIIITRNNQKIARLIPGPPHMTALEAMADLYQTLPSEAGEGWLEESQIRGSISQELRDPWDS